MFDNVRIGHDPIMVATIDRFEQPGGLKFDKKAAILRLTVGAGTTTKRHRRETRDQSPGRRLLRAFFVAINQTHKRSPLAGFSSKGTGP